MGNFKVPGVKWDRAPERVNDHDFRSQVDGLAIPYGVCNLKSNTGIFFVGTTCDPCFAVDCIETWCRTEGCRLYLGAKSVSILADSGGSNGCTPRAWKFAL